MRPGLSQVREAIRTGDLRLVSAKARSHVSPVAIRRALYADRWVPRYRAAIQRVLNKQVRQVARESLISTPEPERHVTQWAEELAREKKRWVYAIVLEGYELAGKEVKRLSGEGKSDGDLRGKAEPPAPPPVDLGREVGGEFLLHGDFEDIDRWVDTTSLGEAQTSAAKLEKVWKDAVASRDPETGAAWTADQIGKQILRRGLTGNVHRADMLAKTGAIWSVNEGAQQRYRAAGVKAEQWLTTKDDALCPYCSGMNGVIVRTDEPFWPAGSEYGNPKNVDRSLKLPFEVQHPPLHPRCRCSLIPVVQPGEALMPTPDIRKPRRGLARKPRKKPKPKPRPVWSPSMTADNADRWAKESVIKKPVYHGTSTERAARIRQEGFKFSKRDGGRMLGDGVYITEKKVEARVWAERLGERTGTTLEIKVNVKKIKTMTFREYSNEVTEHLERAFPNISFRPGGAVAPGVTGSAYEKLMAKISKERTMYFKRQGYDAIRLLPPKRRSDERLVTWVYTHGGTQTIVFDPKNVTVVIR